MSLEITGKLLAKYGTQQVNDRFKKREFVIEIAEEINGNVYTNYAKMQLTQNKCDIIDRHNEGDTIKISFNIKGNKFEKDGRYNFITNLDAWKIESISTSATQAAYLPAQQTASNAKPVYHNPNPETIDDLPF